MLKGKLNFNLLISDEVSAEYIPYNKAKYGHMFLLASFDRRGKVATDREAALREKYNVAKSNHDGFNFTIGENNFIILFEDDEIWLMIEEVL